MQWTVSYRSIIFFSIYILSSCASLVTPVVDENQRDTTGKYDGNWTVTISGSAGQQFSNGALFNCYGIKKKRMSFKVKDGTGTALFGRGVGMRTFYINKSGQFNASATTEDQWTQRGAVMFKPELMLSLKGQLKAEDGSGQYVIGQKLHNGNGCSYRAKFKRF